MAGPAGRQELAEVVTTESTSVTESRVVTIDPGRGTNPADQVLTFAPVYLAKEHQGSTGTIRCFVDLCDASQTEAPGVSSPLRTRLSTPAGGNMRHLIGPMVTVFVVLWIGASVAA